MILAWSPAFRHYLGNALLRLLPPEVTGCCGCLPWCGYELNRCRSSIILLGGVGSTSASTRIDTPATIPKGFYDIRPLHRSSPRCWETATGKASPISGCCSAAFPCLLGSVSQLLIPATAGRLQNEGGIDIVRSMARWRYPALYSILTLAALPRAPTTTSRLFLQT